MRRREERERVPGLVKGSIPPFEPLIRKAGIGLEKCHATYRDAVIYWVKGSVYALFEVGIP